MTREMPADKCDISVSQNDEKQGNLSAYLIGEYRVLWLRLSQLASETGKMHV